jgi:membrane protease YdiL (CAAX protease family)
MHVRLQGVGFAARNFGVRNLGTRAAYLLSMNALRAVAVGMLVALAGTIPRNLLFAANLRFGTSVPWAVPATAVFLVFFWRAIDREELRAHRVPARLWAWSLLAGGLGIVTLVFALRVANRFVALPEQKLPDFSHVPTLTVLALLLAAAPIAGIIEEAAFRGYMQRPLEREHGLVVAILVTGTMFAVAHLDFTLVLWPYYVAVAAIYGTVTSLTSSILPAIVLHTAGNLYSNLDLWLHGRAEWQTGGATRGIDAYALPLALAATLLAYRQLARSAVRYRA